MPDHAFPDAAEDSQHRPDRKPLVCFAADAETEEALRSGLSDAIRQDAEFRRADITRAIAALREMPTPWTLVVDVAGHPQPLAALEDLSQVLEPDVRVLVVGDREDVGFYRQLTRGLGVADYLYKPLTAAMVAENFGPVVTRRRFTAAPVRGGRLLSVTGVRGGVGASTIAANLAWYLANIAHRHSVVLDADLHRGTQALLLSAQAGPGLRNAIEHPDRVDELFVERAATAGRRTAAPAGGRGGLGLAAGLCAGCCGAVGRHAQAALQFHPGRCTLRAGWPGPRAAGPGAAPHPRAGTDAGLHPGHAAAAATRSRAGPGQPPAAGAEPRRPQGRPLRQPGGEALKLDPDIVVPDLPKRLEEAATLGQPAAAAGGPFREAIARLARAAGGVGEDAAPRKGLLARFRR